MSYEESPSCTNGRYEKQQGVTPFRQQQDVEPRASVTYVVQRQLAEKRTGR